MASKEFHSKTCSCCGQSTEYLLALDLGTAAIVMAMSNAIQVKGINCIHPRNEMEVSITPKKKDSKATDYNALVRMGNLTSNMTGNLTHARAHGLIAKIPEQPGNYGLTTKGMAFLKGQPVPKYAIMSKVEHCQIGYFEENVCMVTVNELCKEEVMWQGVGYEIKAGRVLTEPQVKKPLDLFGNPLVTAKTAVAATKEKMQYA